MPPDLNSLLTNEELDLLDSFLLDRVDEEINGPGMDEGILCVSELDGFLTAIVSGPNTVKTVLVVDEWCERFMRGVSLSREAWEAGDATIENGLASILAFCEAGGWTGHGTEDLTEIEKRQLAIAPIVRAIHPAHVINLQYTRRSTRPKKPPA